MKDVKNGDSLSIGFVVIGRNEGGRLRSGLHAIKFACPSNPVVYVDSGSTDGSLEFATAEDIAVVELDMSIPFTAARARNAGFARLLEILPELQYVQFLDGDCCMFASWPATAVKALRDNANVAVVSGRRFEEFPEASFYNSIMDIEWNTPIGETKAVLGDMCVKTDAFREVEGFRENIISAEDDDFCLRIRQAGHSVLRLDAEMSKHDANIRRLSQWYRRSMRGGHGYAQIHHLHGNGPDRYFAKELLSIIFWGAAFPISALVALFVFPISVPWFLAVYILVLLRTALKRRMLGDTVSRALIYSALIYTGKVPEFVGATKFWINHILDKDHLLIEYK